MSKEEKEGKKGEMKYWVHILNIKESKRENKKWVSFTYTVYNELENEIAVNMISQTTVFVESKYSIYGVSLTIAASCAVQESNCSLTPKCQKNEY